MKVLFAAPVALALLNPFAAFADPAKTLKVTERIEINAKADDVWAKSKNYNDLGAWHPAVKKTEIVEGENNKKGAIRLLTLQDGGTIKERLTAHNDKKMLLSYVIIEGVLPVSHYASTFKVEPTKGGKAVAIWEGTFKRKDLGDKPAKGQTDADATNTMSAVYKAGLENLKKISEAK